MVYDPSLILKGKLPKPPFGAIFGSGKIGKTTFCASAPNSIFLPTEKGTDHIDTSRMPLIESWDDMKAAIQWLTAEPHDYKTAVIDSLDHFEPMIHKELERKWQMPLDKIAGGFFRWRAEAVKLWKELIRDLENLQSARGMAVFLIAHYKIKDISDPRTDTYSRIQLKLDEAASSYVFEAVDFVGYAGFDIKTIDTSDDDRKRATSNGQRRLYFVEKPAFQAGNRMGLPAEIPLDWNEFATAWKKAKEA